MLVDEAVRHRRSIRHYLPDPVPATTIRELLSLASLAPSIANRQMWRYIVMTDMNLKRMLAKLVERRIDEMVQWPEFQHEKMRLQAWKEYTLHFSSAPCAIAFINQGYRTPLDALLIERGMRTWEVEQMFGRTDIQSVSAAVAYFTLLAEARGYATCWMTAMLIAHKDLHASLELKSGETLMAFVTMGLPADYPPPKNRKAIDEIIEWR